MALVQAMQGIFPFVSFFYIPKKMARPDWLMMGTCFGINAAHYPALTKKGYRYCFLTAAHTMGPWRCYPELPVPEEYRRYRYVLGKLMLYDEFGAADPANSFDVSLTSVHPTLDIALLTLKESEVDRFEKKAVLERTLFRSFAFEDAHNGDIVDLNGFRGRGQFGMVTAEQEFEKVKKASQQEQQRMRKEAANAVGQQDASSATLLALNNHQAMVNFGTVGPGISGSPCVLRRKPAATSGILCSAVPLKDLKVIDEDTPPALTTGTPEGAESEESNEGKEGAAVAPSKILQPRKVDPGKQYVGFVPGSAVDQWLQHLWETPTMTSDGKPIAAGAKPKLTEDDGSTAAAAGGLGSAAGSSEGKKTTTTAGAGTPQQPGEK